VIARLLETSYLQGRDPPTEAQIHFWLRELRTPTLLIEAAERFPVHCQQASQNRPLLRLANPTEEAALATALRAEEQREREADRQYWVPLRAELERLRQTRRGT
jgi:hypothetical protein